MLDRRSFLQAAVKTAAAAAVTTRLEPAFAQAAQAPASPNDNIQLALIGAGIQGQFDTKTAIQVPGVKLVAVADCYDGRLAPKPCQLSLRVVSVSLLGGGNGVGESHLAAQDGAGLLVSERIECAR